VRRQVWAGAGGLQDGVGLRCGNAKEPGDFQQVGVLGVGHGPDPPGGGADVAEVVTVRPVRSVSGDPELGRELCELAGLVRSDNAVFQDRVQDGEVRVAVAAAARRQTVGQASERPALRAAALVLAGAGDGLETARSRNGRCRVAARGKQRLQP
jgi:hypothetical protein